MGELVCPPWQEPNLGHLVHFGASVTPRGCMRPLGCSRDTSLSIHPWGVQASEQELCFRLRLGSWTPQHGLPPPNPTATAWESQSRVWTQPLAPSRPGAPGAPSCAGH